MGTTASTEEAAMVLVVGDAGPLVEEAARRVVDAVLPACGPAAFNHATYRAADAGTAPIAAANTPPMMADRRLVEIRDLEQAGAELLEALVAYAASPNPTSVVLLVGAGLPKSSKGAPNWGVRLRNAVKRVGRVVEHKTADVDLPGYAVRVAGEVGKALSPADARLLVEWVGADPGRIRREVEKLALYVGDAPEITAAAIEAGSAMLAEAVVWDLTGAIAAGNVDAALGATHRLLEGGEDARRLLGMIAWQLREISRAIELIRRGANDAEIRRQLRVRWDVLKAARRRAGGREGASDLIGRLARANRAMNAHRAGDRRVLEDLVLALCEV